jgi:NADPH:quinone reductase-like Zn-dependent oxidoreductase
VGKYDRVLDVASHHTISEARRVLRRGGVYLIVPGSIAGTLRAMVAGPLMSILGSRPVRMVPWKPFRGEDVAFLTDLLEKRQLRSVIDRIYDFQNIPEALKYQAEGKAMGKIVISLTPRPD